MFHYVQIGYCRVELQALIDFCHQSQLVASDDILARIHDFLDDLYEANQVMNLTRVPPEEAIRKHIIDSLLHQHLLPPDASVLDIGTGPGFPAFPLACLRPDLSVTAMDSSGKMLGFLRRHPLPNLHLIEARAEDRTIDDQFDIVTGRAVAPLSLQLELSSYYCKANGACIPMRTPNDVEGFHNPNFEQLGLELESISEQTLPGTDIVRVFPVYRKSGMCNPAYPRPWAEMKKKAL